MRKGCIEPLRVVVRSSTNMAAMPLLFDKSKCPQNLGRGFAELHTHLRKQRCAAIAICSALQGSASERDSGMWKTELLATFQDLCFYQSADVRTPRIVPSAWRSVNQTCFPSSLLSKRTRVAVVLPITSVWSRVPCERAGVAEGHRICFR